MTRFERAPQAESQGEEIAEQIQSAETLDDLLRVLSRYETITNDEGVEYSTDDIRREIDALLFGDNLPRSGSITRAFGLRDKVADLYGKELVLTVRSAAEALAVVDAVCYLSGSEPLTNSNGTPLDPEEVKALLHLAAAGTSPGNAVTRKYGLRQLAETLHKQAQSV